MQQGRAGRRRRQAFLEDSGSCAPVNEAREASSRQTLGAESFVETTRSSPFAPAKERSFAGAKGDNGRQPQETSVANSITDGILTNSAPSRRSSIGGFAYGATPSTSKVKASSVSVQVILSGVVSA